MSQENKTVELKDEELKKVSGGYSVEGDIEYYEVDDCFKDKFSIYVVTQSGNSQSDWIYYDKYDDRGYAFVFAASKQESPIFFESIKGDYIGKKNTIDYTLTGK